MADNRLVLEGKALILINGKLKLYSIVFVTFSDAVFWTKIVFELTEKCCPGHICQN